MAEKEKELAFSNIECMTSAEACEIVNIYLENTLEDIFKSINEDIKTRAKHCVKYLEYKILKDEYDCKLKCLSIGYNRINMDMNSSDYRNIFLNMKSILESRGYTTNIIQDTDKDIYRIQW